MGKEAVATAGAGICEQAAVALSELPELPNPNACILPPEMLAKAFAVPPPRRLDVPAYHQGWPNYMDSLLLQQIQAANAYQTSTLLPLGAGLGPPAYPSYPYVGPWLGMRDPAQIPLPPPHSYPYLALAGAPQLPCQWNQRLSEKANVLAGRVPVSQAAPGWTGYPGALPFPQGAACDMRGATMQGLEFNGSGVANGQRRDGNQPVQRARMVWTSELHQKFLDAVLKIGVDQAVPKKIMQAMGVDYLTRENVASHLQKYRLQLKREQENKGRTSTSRATPSCSATAPAGKTATGARGVRSAGPKGPSAREETASPSMPKFQPLAARPTPPAERREQPVELQDTAASFRHAPVKMAGGTSGKRGSGSSEDSPGSNTPLGEDKSGSRELASGSRSPQSGSSRTMIQQRKATE
eukprot:jgi/Botrbrau1/22772/Bobra.0132s0102.1